MTRSIDYSRAPSHVDELRDYIENGVMPGRFLRAVLCNNLTIASIAATISDKRMLSQWGGFLYEELPCDTYGSSSIVEAYVANHGVH